jgi:hypothetical protein
MSDIEVADGYTVMCDSCGPVLTRLDRANGGLQLSGVLELAGEHYAECGAKTWVKPAEET